MKPENFTPSAPGRLLPIVGLRGASHAFVPNALPPDWTWPAELWPLLMEAHKQLASLDGTGRHLPNPEIVLRPLQNREAQKSSSLEGTYTDPQAQLIFALNPHEGSSEGDPANAFREVYNYAQALQLRRGGQDLPLSLRLIRELHRVLMSGVRGQERDPGEFRRLQNQVGRPARFVPPPVPELLPLLHDFEKYLHATDGLDPLARAFVAHYQFETIHPFMDGNGRVGRLLLSITIAEWCGLANQWLYMSDYFDRNKDQYIDRLFAVSAEGDWTGWIKFCLRGVVEQARDTLARYERLIELNRDFHDRVNSLGKSVRHSRIVDELFLSPVIQVTRARDLTGVTYPTARQDLRQLKKLGILSEVENYTPITYVCGPILSAVHDD
ncbi:MAG: Fic family protein [Myxococcales bacterium]|nr:Fic family protein [Myxococcales bacterium]